MHSQELQGPGLKLGLYSGEHFVFNELYVVLKVFILCFLKGKIMKQQLTSLMVTLLKKLL